MEYDFTGPLPCPPLLYILASSSGGGRSNRKLLLRNTTFFTWWWLLLEEARPEPAAEPGPVAVLASAVAEAVSHPILAESDDGICRSGNFDHIFLAEGFDFCCSLLPLFSLEGHRMSLTAA